MALVNAGLMVGVGVAVILMAHESETPTRTTDTPDRTMYDRGHGDPTSPPPSRPRSASGAE